MLITNLMRHKAYRAVDDIAIPGAEPLYETLEDLEDPIDPGTIPPVEIDPSKITDPLLERAASDRGKVVLDKDDPRLKPAPPTRDDGDPARLVRADELEGLSKNLDQQYEARSSAREAAIRLIDSRLPEETQQELREVFVGMPTSELQKLVGSGAALTLVKAQLHDHGIAASKPREPRMPNAETSTVAGRAQGGAIVIPADEQRNYAIFIKDNRLPDNAETRKEYMNL